MTLANDRFREQLMGYVYGELEGESLREFEDSLRASEQYRSELAAVQETLRLSREGLGALRARDEAPPTRVSRLVLAAAAEASGEPARAQGVQAAPPEAAQPRRAQSRDRERETSSFWSFLRTPWLLPTLGVAAAVSVVVLHKQVESPKMSEYQAPTVQPGASDQPEPMPEPSRSAAPPPPADPVEAPAQVPGAGGPLAEGVGAGLADAVEHKRDQAPARARARVDQDRPAPAKVAANDSQPGKGYAVPPPAWSGRAREESAKKELAEARRASPSEVSAEKVEEYEAAPARDMGSDGFAARGEGRGGGGVVAAKPAARARSTASQAAPAPAPSAPLASSAGDDLALGGAPASSLRSPAEGRASSSSAGAKAEPPRAPDEAVKKALEHMNARRFGQAAVAYRELLQRYPKDSRVPFFRSQLTAALSALSNVDAIR